MLTSTIGDQTCAPGDAARAAVSSWLTSEIGGFLVGDDAPEESRCLAAREALRNGRDDYCRIARSRPTGTPVEVSLDRQGTRIWAASFGAAPSALALLYVCSVVCRPGDLVHVGRRGRSGTAPGRRLPWPFHLESAERLVRSALDASDS